MSEIDSRSPGAVRSFGGWRNHHANARGVLREATAKLEYVARTAMLDACEAAPTLREEKHWPPILTPEQEACLTLARQDYLVCYLACLGDPDPHACEQVCWDAYCAAFDACLFSSSSSPSSSG